MDRLTVSSSNIITWDTENGIVVVTHRGPPKLEDRGKLAPDLEREVLGNLMMKRVLRDHVDKVASLMIESGLDVNHQDVMGWTPLLVAASEGKVEIVRLLLKQEGIKPNLSFPMGKSALNLAVERGDAEMVSLLLSHPDCNVNFALPGVAAKLIGHKSVNVNAPDREGVTPLCMAVSEGNEYMVRLPLLHSEIDLDELTHQG